MDWVQERARGSPTKPSSPVVPTGDAPPLSHEVLRGRNLSAAPRALPCSDGPLWPSADVERQQWPPGWSPAGPIAGSPGGRCACGHSASPHDFSQTTSCHTRAAVAVNGTPMQQP